MRQTLENIFVAKNNENSDELIQLYIALESELAFFETRLTQLKAILPTEAQCKEREALEERQMVHQLIETMNAYIETLKSNTVLGFKTNKMGNEDIAVLKAQVHGIRALRIAADQGNPQQSNGDTLSKLINDAPKMEHDISLTRRWLRRSASLVGYLASATVAVIAVAALMTPGVNIIAAALMIPTMLASAAAFLYMRNPAVTNTTIFNTAIPVTVPSSFGVIASAGIGISLFRKLRVTNPVREEAARNSATATMNGYSDELRKKISLIDNISVKSFLKSVVDKADTMYNEGVSSWFAETRSSKTLKARLMLRETARILEMDNIAGLTVDHILQNKVGNSDYTFVQLLNAHRNSSTFWNSKTSTMVYLQERGMNETNLNSLSLNLIATAA